MIPILNPCASSSQVRRRLEPLEKAFWAKIMAEAGVTERAKRERDLLLATQQIELGDLRRALRRYGAINRITLYSFAIFIVCGSRAESWLNNGVGYYLGAIPCSTFHTKQRVEHSNKKKTLGMLPFVDSVLHKPHRKL